MSRSVRRAVRKQYMNIAENATADQHQFAAALRELISGHVRGLQQKSISTVSTSWLIDFVAAFHRYKALFNSQTHDLRFSHCERGTASA